MATMAFFLFGLASLVMISMVHLVKHSRIFHPWTKSLICDITVIPVVGVREEWFGITRAALRQLTGGITTLLDGYAKHSRLGRPFSIYESSLQQEVLLPPEHVKWFATQTDGVLSSAEIRLERHAIRYLHAGVGFAPSSQFIDKVLRESLTRNLAAVQGPMYEELERSINRVFGEAGAGATEDETTEGEGEWRTLSLYEAVQDATFPVMSRIFFGLPLCRDAHLLRSFKLYCAAMGLGTVVVGQLPRVLKRLVVPIFNLPLWYYRRRTLGSLIPAMERAQDKSKSDPESGCDTYDFFQQCVQTSTKLSGAQQHGADAAASLAEYVMIVCFTGLLSQVTQTSNLILDVASCSPEKRLLQNLRDEAAAVIRSEQDWKSPATFKSGLPLADSTIRESLRCHPILIKGLTKEVVRPEGVELPDGTLMAQGLWLGIPVLGIHMDERFYPDAKAFDPYRFVAPPTELSERAPDAEQIAAARPTSTYFGFGYGRHACPGRWFAVLMLKMMLAYITLNYDIESVGAPPRMKVIGDAALPPLTATIRVRRRRRDAISQGV